MPETPSFSSEAENSVPPPVIESAQSVRATEGLMPLKEYLVLHPYADRRGLVQQVAILLALCHTVRRCIYGEVKLSSVMVTTQGSIELVQSMATIPITHLPRAPANPEERLPMTTATDVYAFAWLVFHVFTDIDPLELARNPDMMRLIASGVKPNRPAPQTLPAIRGLNDRIWNMCLRCWEISPIDRPPITEVIQVFDTPGLPGAEVSPPSQPADSIVGSRITVDATDSQEHVSVLVEKRAAGGHYSTTYKGQQSNGQVVAVKVLDASATIDKPALQQTAAKLQRMHHPNVLPLWGTTEVASSPVLVSPWVQNGNIKQFLARNPEADRLSLMHDVLSGLIFIHEELGMPHGGVASDNVLVSEESKAVLADAGMPAVIDTPIEDGPLTGPIPHERVRTSRCPVTRAMDVWFYGRLVLETFIGSPPAFSASGKPIHPGPRSEAVKRGLNKRLWDVCENCLEPDPIARPGSRTVMEQF